jgi:CHAT domain-containing protein/Tfp pilus assembly protein PilF
MTSDVLHLVEQLFVKLVEIQADLKSKRYELAIEAAEAALQMCEEAPPDPDGVISAAEGSIAANAFAAARQAGHLDRSLSFAQHELVAAEKNGSASTKVRALNNRGLAYHELNQLVAAEADYRKALRIIEENPGKDLDSMKSLVLSHLGQLLTTQGQEDEAQELLSHSASAEVFGSPFLTITDPAITGFNDRAMVALRSGDYTTAESILRQALARSYDGTANMRGILICNLAEVMHQSGRKEEAIELYKEAIELHSDDPGSTVELATDYVNLADLYMRSGEPRQSADCYKAAWDGVRETNPRSLVALRALWGLATNRMVQKDYTRARAAISRGLELYELMRPDLAVTEEGHAGFLSAYRSLLEMGMYLALHQSWPEELRSLINRGKARFALERVARTSEKAKFEKEGRDFDSIAGMNGLMLDYFVGPNATFVSYQYNKNLGGARIDVPEKNIGQAIDEFREELASSSRRAKEGLAAARLSKLLLEKVKLDAIKVRYVYYLPDGPLWYVPFEALPLKPDTEAKDRKTLGELAPGSYAPSTSVLSVIHTANAASHERSSWRMVAFGEPENGASFPRLEGTAKELAHLEQLADGRFEITVKRGAEATRQNFLALAPGATHIHIAAHAVADFESEQPYIVFSGTGEEQFLRSGDLDHLKLRAEVVFLSACSTSVGKSSTGEGVMSLARAFLWNGCRCVVASLWPMPDDGTPDIVKSFYSGLVAGLSTAKAMQLARDQSRVAGGGAKTWAGFQVFGDGDTWRDRYSLSNIGEDIVQ